MVSAAGPEGFPAALTTFVGRRQEAAGVGARLERGRLVTLTGAGGAGKSRLAIEVAMSRAPRHRDGVRFVELAVLADPLLLAHAVAAGLGVQEQAGRTLPAVLVERLRDADMLLVLDCCEHLVEAVAQFVLTLLSACPNLRVLATSRERLGVPGEVLWPVTGLATPPAHADGAEVLRYDAVRLFADRAAAVEPGFAVTDANAAAVAEICRKLDGLPLAIELAAARTNALDAAQLSGWLDGRFRFLAWETRASSPRHRTLDSVVEWSYNLLSEPERRLFERLAVFAGAFTLDAVEAVTAEGAGTADLGELLLRLVDKSLVTVVPRHTPARYRMLETLRAYGLARLRERGGLASLSAQHAAYFHDLAEQAWERFRGPHQAVWLERLRAEHDDLRAALEYLLASHDIDNAVCLAGALASFWDVQGHYAEGRVRLERALGADRDATAKGRVRALNGLGLLAVIQGDVERARQSCSEAERLSRRNGDLPGLACALQCLGFGALLKGNPDGAAEVLGESLEVALKTDEPWLEGWSYLLLAMVEVVRSDFTRASRHGRTAFRLLYEAGEPKGIAWAHLTLATASWGQEDVRDARARTGEALRLFHRLDAPWGLAEVFQIAAMLAMSRQHWDRAAALFGAADTARKKSGAALPAFLKGWRAAGIRKVRAELGDRRFGPAREHGLRWPLDAAVLAAAAELGTAPPPLPPARRETPRTGALRGEVSAAEAPRNGAAGGGTRALVESGTAVPHQAALRRKGDYWTLDHDGLVVHLKHTVGLGYLARLLSEPDREFLARELAAADRGPAAPGYPGVREWPSSPGTGDAGPALDARAKTAYRRRLRELAEELEEAERFHDTGRAERARVELDAVTEQLAGAVGLGGRDRRAASDTERARLSVTKALKAAVKRVAVHDPVLGLHLQRSVRTGAYCSYAPDPATRIVWR
ncbi:regulator [Streptomyces albofaciens JCM 4342]|uniref:ATP-binding protein n=1 Tax=Streptomyces albofaciens TaxID=66866 RepID=UPI00123B064D|nr:regulator [Streptomyces albofaciens]KAA6212552.1 regulator [Streptomyces albofaciens JCM 4342]